MIIDLLDKIIKEELKKLNYEIDLKVVKSNRPDLCDYQFDGVFKLAKLYHKNPTLIGEEIVNSIKNRDDYNYYFKECSFVKPGFINMIISNKLINETLIKMNKSEKFGLKKPAKEDTYILDYGGANIAKPLHVGHMRSPIVGESVKRIINYMGHKTISDVHLGDYGLQIGQVIYGLKQEKKTVDDINLELLEYIYPKISNLCKNDEKVKEECSKITKELQEGNLEYYNYFKKIREISGNDIKNIYKYLGVDFDIWYGESDAYKYIDEAEKIINDKNLFTISEGAKIVDVKKEKDLKEMPPLIFKNSIGAYLYGTTDIATILQREKDFKPDYILYFADLRQQLHFEQVFRVIEKSKISDAKLEFLGFGTINGIDGKPYKTRDGQVPKLSSLFEEVRSIFIDKKEENKNMSKLDQDIIVNSILKFADLQNNREKDYIFDISKFSEVVGKTGPYVLYTYLRTNKILEKINTELNDEIYNEFDRNLRIKLIEFDLYLNNAFTDRLPNILADYVYDLCVCINAFYQNNRINNLTDDDKKQNWIYVLTLANKLLKDMLKLLIIDIPEFM